MTWQTRTICTYVAASVPVETEGEVSQLLESALKVGLPVKKDEEKQVEAWTPDQPSEAREPKQASFERFMGSFGNPRKWAGAN